MNVYLPRRTFLVGLASGALGLPAAQAQTASWPTKAVRIVMPFPAGGSPDQLARQLAEQLAGTLGQAFVVENKPGASGLIAARSVSQNPSDSHAILYISSGHVTLQAINPSFNLLKELRPVARISSSPFVCVVGASSPYKTMQELTAAVMANPGKLSFGTAGMGSPAHMAVEYLEERLPKFKGLHVPFKGAVESINAILSNQIDFGILLMGTAVPHIQGGRLRALAMTTPKPVPQLPDVPTIADTVAPGYSFDAWGGFAMASAVPDEIVTRLHQALQGAVASGPVRALVSRTGSLMNLSPSAREFSEQIQRELTLEASLVKKLGLS